LAIEELLGDGAGKATEEMALAVDDNLFTEEQTSVFVSFFLVRARLFVVFPCESSIGAECA